MIWPAGLPALAVALCLGVYVTAVLDRLIGSLVAGRREKVGPALLAPVRAASFLLMQSGTRTERPDGQLWALAPAMLVGLAAVGLSVVPVGPQLAVSASASGFVLFAAAVAFVMVAVYLHGWSANSALPLIGAYRFVAEAISYQIPFLLVLLATALPAESLSVVDIVASQQSAWNVARQPLGLPLYLLVGLGVAFWGPLNLADAADVAGGTALEVSGAHRLLWKAAQSAILVAVAAMGAAAFLGGWWGPWLPGWLWVVLKTVLLLAVLVVARHVMAPVTVERFVTLAWTLLIPLALADVFLSGVLLI